MKKNIWYSLAVIIILIPWIPQVVLGQDSKQEPAILTEEKIKADLDRVFTYLNANTPSRITNRESGAEITHYKKIDSSSYLARGHFGITSYEWGVTYSGMLRVAAVTGDQKYADYTFERFKMLGESYPYFKKVQEETGTSGLRSLITPKWLDDCGSMGAAMMKASLVNPDLAKTIRPVIDNAFDFVMYKEHRLYNRMLARNRPNKNSVWLDDMYMGIPPIAYMGKLVEKEDSVFAETCYQETALQIKLFHQLMWIPEKNLFRHGWIEMMTEHPSFFWGRANGWAALTLCDVLDIFPEDHKDRPEIMALFRKHLRGLSVLQSGEGFWHQLLDRNDSYMETSATAMYTYCLAHAINKGWIDPLVYGPIAIQGWKAVATMINEQGQVEGTCVGTGLGFDPGFYYHRPVSVFAAHGYGPVLLAGAEMIELLKNTYPKMNDSAVQFYKKNIKPDGAIFEAK